MVSFIDVHCHLDHRDLSQDIDSVISHAEKSDVRIIITNGLNKETNRRALQLSEKYPTVKAALGIYPVDAFTREIEEAKLGIDNSFDFDEEIEFIEKNKDRTIAVGEIGLDYADKKSDKEQQKEHFRKLLMLAKRIDKPVIVHSRKAEADVIEILASEGMKKVVMHCFSGKKKLLMTAVKHGWYFTVPTHVVRSHQFQYLAEAVPLNRLFAETDAPFLTPFKEKPNEPAFVVESYKKIAEIKGMELEEVKNNVFINFKRLFG